MTSRKIEDVHLDLLNKLFADSGLECVRSPHLSSESSSSLGASEEQGIVAEEEETAVESVAEEEQKAPIAEEVPEELPEIFPTPSLRLTLSDKVRHIQKQNRIHVLPEEFKTHIDPLAIPKIAVTPQQKYIEMLADIVGCKRYRSSLAEFWFLDTLANLLWRAQDDELDRPTQAILILWFCEWMKEMQHFDAADRPRMMRRFKDNMLAAAKILAMEERLPAPSEAGVHYKAVEEPDEAEPTRSSIHAVKHLVSFEGAVYECCLRDLIKIIHYIFDLFSTDYQYNLVRSIFTFTPEYALIDAPYQLQNPKKMYTVLKVKPKKEPKSPKKEAKPVKGKQTKNHETAEYTALLEMKAKEEKFLEEQEERDREDWNRRSHILPLSFAANDEFFNKYWPPPIPEPEPEIEIEVKPKAKTKGKK
ncbi:unnamed protein product [Chrysodeixis includens]|uniref:Uncharacterized protein n=1 Tax=Chrysodeixis includens TaxID=689277 RepID=A0A9P0FWR4_CHRIL|nr:unnamed protein product [Chrysodeixis includens]